MSFYTVREKDRFLMKGKNKETYGRFFDFPDRDAICTELVRTVEAQRSTFSVCSDHVVRKQQITDDMNLILAAGGFSPVTARSVASVFSVKRARYKQTYLNSTNIRRRHHSDQLYVETRYWGQAETMAFCIAAQLSEEQAQQILGPMMGQPWLYLRDPYILVTDYALNRGLTASQTAGLLRFTTEQVARQRLDAVPAENTTRHLRSRYNDYLKSKPMDTAEAAIARFQLMVEDEKENLAGDFTRTVHIIRKLILLQEWTERDIVPDPEIYPYFFNPLSVEKTNLRHLAQQLARSFVPWESKGKADKQTDPARRHLLTTGVNKENVIYERLRAYMKPLDYREIRYAEMRMDLIRLLLIYGVSDISTINHCLMDLSFNELNPALPFDFFVLSAIAHGSGTAAGDPYAALAELMAYFSGWAERRITDAPHETEAQTP